MLPEDLSEVPVGVALRILRGGNDQQFSKDDKP
jgi:hypothetical protein